MRRASSARQLSSAFTLMGRLLALPERIADLFSRRNPARHSAPLNLEAMEERLVPDGRPLPLPTIYVGAGVGHAPVIKAYNAETGEMNFAALAYEPSFQGGVRVATGDFTGDGFPDVVAAPGPGHAPRIRILDGTTGELIDGPVASFLAFGPGVQGGVYVAAADVDGDQWSSPRKTDTGLRLIVGLRPRS